MTIWGNKVMKKLILILFIFFFFNIETYSHDTEIIKSVYVCMTTGIQGDFLNNIKELTYSFDNNFTLFFINGGLNYNSYNTAIVYSGIGWGSLIQIQYGKPLGFKENLIRVRLDYPLMLHFHKDSSFFNYAYVGIYYINSDKIINFNENYGITFSVNVNRAISKLSR